MSWKPGRYDLTFCVVQAGQRQHREDFVMTLTPQQVDKLRTNIDQLEASIRLQEISEQLVLERSPPATTIPAGLIPPVWNWVSPEISRA